MVDEDILTFEQLKDIQNTEQDEDTLGDLDDQFFERVRDYLNRKQRIGGHLNDKEYRNAKHIVRDILDSRQKKIIRLAFLSTKSDISVENLLPEEEVLFDKVRESITEHRRDIEDQLFSDDKEPDPAEAATTDSGTGEDTTADRSLEEADTDTGDQETEENEREPGPTPDSDDDEEMTANDEEEQTEDDELLEPGDDTDDETEDDNETTSPSPGDEEDTESAEGDDDGELLFGGGDDTDEDDNEPDERTTGDLEADDGDEQEEKADNDDDDTEDDGEEMVEVRMTADVSEFMGVDLQSYGPFEEGETATIPDENAEVLQDQDKAEPLE